MSETAYNFCSLQDLVDSWCKTNYPEQAVLVLFDSMSAFEFLPMLAILKRDNFKAYSLGSRSEFAIIEFESAERAYDFVKGFNDKHNIRWTIYKDGEKHATSKKEDQNQY